MSNIQADLNVPISKWLLKFHDSPKLESKYLDKSKEISNFYMKRSIQVLNGLLIPALLLLVLFYCIVIYWKNLPASQGRKRFYWGIQFVPITLVCINLDYFLSKKISKFSKFRGILTVLLWFYIIGDSTAVLFDGKDVFGSIALIALITIYWYGEKIICNYIMTGICAFLGMIIIIVRMSFGGVRVSLYTFSCLIGISVMLIIVSRLAEMQNRKDYFLLECVKEREEEYKRVLSSLTVGILIHDKNSPFDEIRPRVSNSSSRQSSVSVNSEIIKNPKIKYFNPALKSLLYQYQDSLDISFGQILFRKDSFMHIEESSSMEIIRESSMEIDDNNRLHQFIENIYSSSINGQEIWDKKIISYEVGGKMKELQISRIYLTFEHAERVGLIIDDLTNFKTAQREKISKEFQSRLVKTITHEIRSPLNTIQGNSEILEDKVEKNDPREEQFDCILKIQNGVKFLLGFIDCMLGLSIYQEHGRFQHQYEVINIQSVVAESIDLFQEEAEAKGLSLESHIEENFPTQIIQDPKSIYQLLFVLISNALKYTFEGAISIHLTYNLQTKTIKIVVRDTGIGISPENQNHLFKLYGEGYRKNQEFGLGIGLTLCKALIDSLEGHIKLWSKIDEGTAITLKLPGERFRDLNLNTEENLFFQSGCFTHTSENINPSLEPYRNISQPKFLPIGQQIMESSRIQITDGVELGLRISEECKYECPKILIVDDQQSNIFVLKGLLNLINLKADEARHGGECIEKVKAAYIERSRCCKNYSVILMDCNMPIMNGYEATKELASLVLRREINSCLVIGVTAYTSPENTRLCYDAGMSYVLHKPVSLQLLKQAFKSLGIFLGNIG